MNERLDGIRALPPSWREVKKERMRRTIQDAAVRLFRTRGYDDVTVDQICRSAGVARSTFFRYYPSKADVLPVDDRPGSAGRGRELRQALAQVLARCGNRSPEDFQVRVAATVLATALVSALEEWNRDNGRTDLADLLELALNQIETGLRL